MGIRDFFPWLRQKASSVTRVIVQLVGTLTPVYSSTDYYTLARVGYERNVYVYRAINLIATACAGIPWVLYNRPKTRRGRVREIEDHALLKLLRRPNPEAGQGRFIRDVVAFWLLSGNSYIEAVGPETRQAPPLELWPLRPDRMRVKPDEMNRVGGYRYEAGPYKKDLPREKVLHLKMFAATDDWYGLSPVKVAARIVDQSNSGDDWNTALLQNAGKPSLALVYKGVQGGSPFLDDASYQRLKQEIRTEWSGPANAGTPKLLEGGLDVVKLGLSPTEMDWIKGDERAGIKIAIALGVPPELLGLGQKTYSNMKEARKDVYTETVLPLMDELRDQLNNWLVPMFGDGLYLDYDRDEIEALAEDRNQVAERLNKAWWLTPNERREAMGYEPMEGGDILLVPANMTPIDTIGDAEPFGPEPGADSEAGAGGES